jgi:hypothetical protein
MVARACQYWLDGGYKSRAKLRQGRQVEAKEARVVSIFRKAYSVAGAVLMIQFLLQLYLVAAALLTIVQANDNAKDVYTAFKNADTFTGLHRLNGDLAALTILVMVGCSFGSRYPWRTTILTAVLLVLLIIQSSLSYVPIPLVSGLHGVNALILIGLGGYLTGRNWAFRRGPEVAHDPS